MVKRAVWSLLWHLHIAFVISDVEIPLSCSDTSEEFYDTTSLLQVSVAHSEPGYPTPSLKDPKGFLERLQQEIYDRIWTRHIRRSKGVVTDLYGLYSWQTDTFTLFLIVFVIANSLYGWSASWGDKSSMPTWIIVMLVVSYMCFIMGLFAANSTCHVAKDTGFDMIWARHPVTSTPNTIISMLLSMSGWPHIAGLVFLILVVCGPMAKLLLLIATKILESRYRAAGIARTCVIAIRVSAKWASPLHLVILAYHCRFLQMDHAPGIDISAVLDIGWVGFTLFCVTNLISALALPMPDTPRDQRPRGRVLSDHCKVFMFVIVVLNAVLYLILLVIGSCSPLYSVKWTGSREAFGGFDPSKVAKDSSSAAISLVQCLSVLIECFWQRGHMIALVAFFALLFGTVLLAIADMSVLTLCAYCAYRGNNKEFTSWISVSRVTRHCAMVDVLVVGMLLASLSDFFRMEIGVFQLLVAELVRYLVTYVVIENAATSIELRRDRGWYQENRQTSHLLHLPGVKSEDQRARPPFRADQSESDTSSMLTEVRGVIRVDNKRLDESESDVPIEVIHFDEKTKEDTRVSLPVTLPKRCSDDIRWELEGSRGAAMTA